MIIAMNEIPYNAYESINDIFWRMILKCLEKSMQIIAKELQR
jgi:hypothetical protein